MSEGEEDEEEPTGGNPLARGVLKGGKKAGKGGRKYPWSKKRKRRKTGAAGAASAASAAGADGAASADGAGGGGGSAAPPPRQRSALLDEPRVPHTKLPRKEFTQATLAYG